jgi:type IV secretion system protein VirB11
MALSQLAPAGVYLQASLAPFDQILARPDVTDIYVNRPGELWVEILGGAIERHEDPCLTEATLARLARQIAALTHQGISRESPLLAATLPDGSRIQVIAPPATRGPLALSIRRQVSASLTLEDYTAEGLFAETRAGPADEGVDAEIRRLLARRDFAEALSLAVRSRKNILVAGGTSTGKTTFLNALLREVPRDERLILIEDTPELVVGHDNHVGLVSVRGELGEARVSMNDLVSASLRMRPDRIILGELRGLEALAFLRAVISGHPGSMTTIHADSPAGAVEQLVMLVLQGGTKLSRADVRHYVAHSIDVFVQLSRVGARRTVGAVVLNEVPEATGGAARNDSRYRSGPRSMHRSPRCSASPDVRIA